MGGWCFGCCCGFGNGYCLVSWLEVSPSKSKGTKGKVLGERMLMIPQCRSSDEI